MVKNYFVYLVKSKILILLVFLFFIPQNAFSQEAAKVTAGIEVQPAYVDVDLTPKAAEEEIGLTYTNHSKQPVTLELFPIDFHSTDEQGGIGFTQSKSEYLYSLSSYLSFETSRLDLAPGEKKVFTLLAKNRQDLTPGGHYAAVVARVVQDKSEETTVAPAVSTLIFLRKLSGESYNLSLKKISWPRTITFSYPPTVTALFQNQGNTHLTPIGKMEVKDMFGRILSVGVLNEGFVKVLPSSQRFIPIYMKRLNATLPFSINTLTLKGADSHHKVTYSRTDVFIYVHPLFLITVIAILFGAIVWRRKARRMKHEVRSKVLKSGVRRKTLKKEARSMK